MKNVILYVCVIAMLASTAYATQDYILKPLPGAAKIVTYSSVVKRYAAQINADRAQLRKMAGASGHAQQRAILLARIRHARIALAAIRRGENPAAFAEALAPRTLKCGDVGVFRNGLGGKVLEVLNPGAALCVLYYGGGESGTMGPGGIATVQSYTAPSTLVICFRGFDLHGVTDSNDCDIGVPGAVQVSRYTYATVTGASATVLAISPVKFVDDLHKKKAKK